MKFMEWTNSWMTRFFDWLLPIENEGIQDFPEQAIAQKMFPGVKDSLQLHVLYMTQVTGKSCSGQSGPDGRHVITVVEDESAPSLCEGLESPDYLL